MFDTTRAKLTNVSCQINQDGPVSLSWILLDNCSTVDVFHNGELLENIRSGMSYMDIHCNAGMTSTNLVGDLPGYGEVWYHPNGIANILSLARVKDHGYHVTYDSHNGNEFRVYNPNNDTTRTFKESNRGLYFMESNDKTGTVLVNTVSDNKSNFSNVDYSRAVLARQIQKTIGRPSTRTFINIIEKKLLANCPVTRRDIEIAEEIFGPDVGSLKGKTVRRGGERVNTHLVDIPATVMSHYKNVTLAGDIMFVNKIPFFITISRHLRFGTAENISNQNMKTLLASVKQVKSTYMKRGFILTHVLMDGQFEPLRADLADIQIDLNTVSADEHVPEIERHIRTVKERVRCIYNTLPFKKMPARLIIEMVYTSVFWINSFPHADGVSKLLSPRAIVIGLQLDYNKHCQLEFGTYVQTHEEHDNSMTTRTTGALALRPTGNVQGGHYFLSLTSGRRINRNRWTTLPMPNDVIDRIHALARRSGASLGITFTDRDGNLLFTADDDYDSDDDETFHPDDNDDDHSLRSGDNDDALNDDASDDGDDDNPPDNEAADMVDPGVINGANEGDDNENFNHQDGSENESGEDGENFSEGASANESVSDDDENHDQNNDDVIRNARANENASDDDMDDDQNDNDVNRNVSKFKKRNVSFGDIKDMDTKYGARSGKYELRARRPRDYAHLHATLESIVMTQYSMTQGIKLYGEKGVDSVLDELKQLHDRGVIEPRKLLTRDEKSGALNYLMFIKQKRCGRIKARGCADGRKQRIHTTKQEASSPTVAIESLLLTCVIDAEEHRDVAVVDIPGAFMQVDMDELVFMRLDGKMAEIMVRIDPDLYSKFVVEERGKKVIYVELKKALYGTLRAALLFWQRLTAQFKEWGFEVNPYDWCVVNKTIGGKQCTIVWHVDDLKISHVDTNVVGDIIEDLDSVFGNEAPLTIHRGKLHEYLGMTLCYDTPGTVRIVMTDYVQGMVDELPDDMIGHAFTPAPTHLFDVNDESRKLDEEKAIMFHHNVAKLLFLCKRARPDIQTAVSFLCTRVKNPDTDDYKKLSRVMKYLQATINMPLSLEGGNMSIIKWWVDASYAVHPDMRSHTGSTMSLGKGSIYSSSTRQKLNTKSSTEAELVGVSDAMTQIVWTRYFMKAQGYEVKENVVGQDNMSAMLLENNGRASSSKRTRHINIRYFFVTDRIKNGEVSVVHCPTGEMVADFFTKPLQGATFRKFRDLIMNNKATVLSEQVDPVTDSVPDQRSVLGDEEKPCTELLEDRVEPGTELV